MSRAMERARREWRSDPLFFALCIVWKDALNNLHKLSVLELPGILGILES